jgi:hypothetical protein
VPLFLRPWAPGDEAAFTPRPDFASEMAAGGHDWAAGPPAGVVWTLCRWGGEVVGVAGIQQRGQDFDGRPWMHLWACLAPITRREVAWAVRLARAEIRRAQIRDPYAKFYAWARETLPGAVRCLEAMGLHATGHAYIPDLSQTYISMVR